MCNNWQHVKLYSKQIGGSMLPEQMLPLAAVSLVSQAASGSIIDTIYIFIAI